MVAPETSAMVKAPWCREVWEEVKVEGLRLEFGYTA
jgi:hypothetical protein